MTRMVMAGVLALLGTLDTCSQTELIVTDTSHSFESRDACDEVIRMFNNTDIKSQGEDLQMQIRFADTQEQKSLKQQTQAARQFRSAEYEYATQAWRQGRLPYAGTTLNEHPGNTNEFEQFMGGNASVPIQGQRWAQSAIRQMPGRSPLGSTQYNAGSQSQTPLVQVSVTGTSDRQPKVEDDGSLDATANITAPASTTTLGNTPVDSAASPKLE